MAEVKFLKIDPSTGMSTEHDTAGDQITIKTITIANVAGAEIAMSGKKITGMGAATVNGDAVRYEQLTAEQTARSDADTSLASRVGVEETARANADTTLSNRIGQEVSDRSAADTSLSNALGQEVSDRGAADTSLSNALGQEISDRSAADLSLATRLGTEETTRANADTTLSNRIGQEVSDRSGADTTLSNRLGQEISDRGAADTSIASRLGTEESNRTSGDLSLSDRIDALATTLSWRAGAKAATQDTAWFNVADGTALSAMPNAATKIFSDDDHTVKLTSADFVAGDYILTKNGTSSKLYQIRDIGGLKVKVVTVQPRMNDTWVVRYDLPDVAGQEETAIYAFDGNDLIKIADFDWDTASGIGVLDNNGVFVQSNVEGVLYELYTNAQNDKSAYQAADTTLSNRIGQEISDRAAAELTLSNRIGQEVSDRGAADLSLSNRIGQEVSDRGAADLSLATRLGVEETARANADTTLSNRIGQEVSDRSAGDLSLSNRIGQEISDRAAAELLITNAIGQEVSDRGAADTSLSNRIGQEVSDRSAADTSLQNQITAFDLQTAYNHGRDIAVGTLAVRISGAAGLELNGGAPLSFANGATIVNDATNSLKIKVGSAGATYKLPAIAGDVGAALVVGTTTSGVTALQWGSASNLTFNAGEDLCQVSPDAVRISANNTVVKAQADAITNANMFGVTESAVSSGATNATVSLSGSVIEGCLTDAVPGAAYYLSESVAGKFTTAVPSGHGNVVLRVGYAKNATDLILLIGEPRVRG